MHLISGILTLTNAAITSYEPLRLLIGFIFYINYITNSQIKIEKKFHKNRAVN